MAKRTRAQAPPLFPGAPAGSTAQALASDWTDLDRHADLAERVRGEAALLGELIAWGAAVHAADPEVLWATARRSPARVALQLAARAGVELAVPPALLARAAVRRALAHDPHMSPRVLEAVALAEPVRPPGWGTTTLDVLARNPALDEGGVAALIERGAIEAAALARAASEPQLRELARDPATRRALAENPRTPLDVLATLTCVDEQLAMHPASPWPVLERLLDAPIDAIAEAAARHPNVPAARLAALAAGSRKAHRRGAAANPTLPPALRATLLADVNPTVRALAIGRDLPTAELARLLATAGAHREWVARAVAMHPNASPATLAELARDADLRTVASTAANPALSPATLAALATHDEALVRVNAARNPNAPLAMLLALAHDTDDAVYREALGRLPWRDLERITIELEPKLARTTKLENIGLDLRLSPRWLARAARKAPLEAAHNPHTLLEDLPA